MWRCMHLATASERQFGQNLPPLVNSIDTKERVLIYHNQIFNLAPSSIRLSQFEGNGLWRRTSTTIRIVPRGHWMSSAELSITQSQLLAIMTEHVGRWWKCWETSWVPSPTASYSMQKALQRILQLTLAQVLMLLLHQIDTAFPWLSKWHRFFLADFWLHAVVEPKGTDENQGDHESWVWWQLSPDGWQHFQRICNWSMDSWIICD